MVSSLGPGKFYGSSLPRPRFYSDVKYNTERVDPPLPVNDALIKWANEAHWSMGGVNFTRHRFQGRIEGNVEKLRVQREKQFKKKIGKSPSPPDAPLALKRRRVLGLVEENEEEERVGLRRGAVRKLGSEFEKVARESGMIGESPKTKKTSGKKKNGESPLTPEAPLALRKRRVLLLVVEKEGEERVGGVRRGAVRKLGGEFERVARESGMVVEKEDAIVFAKRTTRRSKKKEQVVVEKNGEKLVRIGEKLAKIGGKMVAKRTSPRLVKS